MSEKRYDYNHPSYGYTYNNYAKPKMESKMFRHEDSQTQYEKPVDVGHELLVIKDLLKAILNTLDEQKLTLDSHSDVLDELSDLLLSDDD